MTAPDDRERLARVALSRLAEPGDLRVLRLVREVGAPALVDLLRGQRDGRGVHTDVAERLRGLDPERELADAAALGIRFVCPGDSEWPVQLDALDRCDPLDRRAASAGLWVRGPLDLAATTAKAVAVVGSRSATTYGADVAGRARPRPGAGGGVRWCPGRRSGSTRPPTAAASPATGRPWPCWPAASTGPIPPATEPAGPPGRDRAGGQRGASWGGADPLPLPHPQPADRRAVPRHRGGRGGGAQRGAQHRDLDRSARAGADGGARAGHQRAVGGRARADPLPEGLVTRAAHVPELVGAVGDDLAPVPRAEETPRDRLPAVQRRVLEAVPVVRAAGVDSIARTGGLSVTATSRALEALLAAGARGAAGRTWRLAAPMAGRDDPPP